MAKKTLGTVMEARACGYEECGGSWNDEFLSENKIKRSGTMSFESEYGDDIEIPFTAVFTFGRPRIQKKEPNLREMAASLAG